LQRKARRKPGFSFSGDGASAAAAPVRPRTAWTRRAASIPVRMRY